MTHFFVYNSTMSTVLDTLYAPIDISIDVNSRTLKDIGAPDWMIARADERHNSHTIHLLELFRS